uniref:Uncharacterized protein n=1 Tax=Anguilla anguilla TaxID=7936 RepID=A0A0E9QHW2_ANGAN
MGEDQIFLFIQTCSSYTHSGQSKNKQKHTEMTMGMGGELQQPQKTSGTVNYTNNITAKRKENIIRIFF